MTKPTPSPIGDTEAALLEHYRCGEPDAARRIYERYVRYLTAIAGRYAGNDTDTADVLQDAFLKIFTALPGFTFRGEGSLKAWMARVVLNEALTFVTRRGRLPLTDADVDTLNVPDETPDTAGVPTAVIYDLIRRLPDGYRTIFNLYAVEGMSHKQIADRLGIKENTSASQLHKARAMLARQIRDYKQRHDC